MSPVGLVKTVYIHRIDRIFMVYLVIFLLKIPHIHRIHMFMATHVICIVHSNPESGKKHG